MAEKVLIVDDDLETLRFIGMLVERQSYQVLARTTRALEFSVSNEHSHGIGVLSAKGGLGVTTVAINLSIAIETATNSSVIVAEVRPSQGSISLKLGYQKLKGSNRLLQQKP